MSVQHFGICLQAKTCQLKEAFQAKLGWLIGNLYSRVATAEWDTENPGDLLSGQVKKLLRQSFVTCEDEQIREGISALKRDGTLDAKSPVEIAETIKRTRVVPRSKQFRDRVGEVLSGMKVVEPLRGKLTYALKTDDALKQLITAMVAKSKGNEKELTPQGAADAILDMVAEKVAQTLSDDTLPRALEVHQRVDDGALVGRHTEEVNGITRYGNTTGLTGFDPKRSAFSTWLFTVARNRCRKEKPAHFKLFGAKDGRG